MPPQRGRSRPRVAHEGECSRKYHNKRRLDWRIERFRAAHRADRSDECPWAISQFDVDDYSADGFTTSRGAYDDVHGQALIDAMNEWELLEQLRKAVARADYRAREAKRARTGQVKRPSDRQELDDRLRRRVQYWRERCQSA